MGNRSVPRMQHARVDIQGQGSYLIDPASLFLASAYEVGGHSSLSPSGLPTGNVVSVLIIVELARGGRRYIKNLETNIYPDRDLNPRPLGCRSSPLTTGLSRKPRMKERVSNISDGLTLMSLYWGRSSPPPVGSLVSPQLKLSRSLRSQHSSREDLLLQTGNLSLLVCFGFLMASAAELCKEDIVKFQLYFINNACNADNIKETITGANICIS